MAYNIWPYAHNEVVIRPSTTATSAFGSKVDSNGAIAVSCATTQNLSLSLEKNFKTSLLRLLFVL
jgi:spore coat protein U-like protein